MPEIPYNYPVNSKKSHLMIYIQSNIPFFIDSYGNSLIYFENIPLSSIKVKRNEPPKTLLLEMMTHVDL